MTVAEIKRYKIPPDVERHYKNLGAQAERRARRNFVAKLQREGTITSITANTFKHLDEAHMAAIRKRRGGIGL